MLENEVEKDEREVPRMEEFQLIPAHRAFQTVFQNELVLDKILHFALDPSDDVKLQITTVKSCKLVNRMWCARVSAALHKSPPEWYKVQLKFFEKPEKAEKFYNTFPANNSAHLPNNRIPPFTLTCSSNDFDPTEPVFGEIYNTLWNCLTMCGSDLVELHLAQDYDKWPWQREPTFYFLGTQPLCLPKLEKLEMILNRGCDCIAAIKTVYKSIKLLLELVLAGCQVLQQIFLAADTEVKGAALLPFIYENLTLPPTLVLVKLNFVVTPGLLTQLLLKNSLPVLTTLHMQLMVPLGTEYSIAKELQQVLDQLCPQLKQLKVNAAIANISDRRVSQQPVVIILPVTESLEMFESLGMVFEWSVPVSTSNNKKYFPALKTISLNQQTFDLFVKGVKYAEFSTVQEACVHVRTFDDDNNGPDFQILLERMQRVYRTLPNVVKLEVETNFTRQLLDVKYIFQTMTQLNVLSIGVYDYPEDMTADMFDSLFLELSPEEESTLATRRDDWKSWTQQKMPALRKLQICLVPNIYESLPSCLGWNFDGEEED